MDAPAIKRYTFAALLSLLLFVSSGCLWQREPASFPGGGFPSAKRSDERTYALMKKCEEWHSLGASVNPLLREYYLANKSKCTFPHNDNEAEIEGFANFARQHGITLKKGRIVDPWGVPVHFVVAHEGDRVLRACGEIYGIADQPPDKIAVALLLGKPTTYEKISCGIWSVQNGCFQTGFYNYGPTSISTNHYNVHYRTMMPNKAPKPTATAP
jgi:hypothetical protein